MKVKTKGMKVKTKGDGLSMYSVSFVYSRDCIKTGFSLFVVK